MKVLEAKEKRLICNIFMVFYNCSRLAFDASALTWCGRVCWWDLRHSADTEPGVGSLWVFVTLVVSLMCRSTVQSRRIMRCFLAFLLTSRKRILWLCRGESLIFGLLELCSSWKTFPWLLEGPALQCMPSNCNDLTHLVFRDSAEGS